MKKDRQFFFAVICLLCFACCGRNAKRGHMETIVYRKNNYVVKETYDSGRILSKQFFSLDTLARGPRVEYNANGSIKKWKWFNTADSFPICVVYYNSQGYFDYIKGNPFIDAIRGKKTRETDVVLVNPPNVSFVVVLNDFYQDASTEYKYEPMKTDSVNWVVVGNSGENIEEKGHKYTLYAYVVDTMHGDLFRASKALMFIGSDSCKFVDLPPQAVLIKDHMDLLNKNDS